MTQYNNNIKPKIGEVRTDSQGNMQIYTGSSWSTMSPFTTTGPSSAQSITTTSGGWTIGQLKPQKITFEGTTGKSVSVDEIIDFMEVMKRRLLILEPNFEKHELFPALKEAYEQYMVLERLMNPNHKPDNM